MNLAELAEEVLENISLHPASERVTRGEVKRLLNFANREVSAKIGVPTLYLDVPTVGTITGPFSLPIRVQPEGVKYAEVIEVTEANGPGEYMRNQRIPIMNVHEANTFHPRWENDEDAEYCGPPFLVYSPTMPDTGFVPVGIVTARYRFLVYARPEEMVEDSDEPWAVVTCATDDTPASRRPGAHPDYHRLLAHHVTYELLQRLGDDRWQAFYARYRDMEKELFGRVTPAVTYYPVNTSNWRGRHEPPRY